MSKIKMSFSLILTLILVGMLSTAAFAKDPYGFKPVQVEKTLNLLVNYTANPSAVPAQDQNTTFDLYLIHPTDASKNKTYTGLTVTTKVSGTPSTTSYPGSITIPAADLEAGIVYKLDLTLAGTDHSVTTNILSTTTGLVTDGHNTGMFQTPNPAVDLVGSGQKNANQTGYNNTRKQRSGQKVHGFYQNNTNSCASCHQTHIGADDNLLFKDGVYSTCSACHDGTTGAYNNFAPVTEETAKSMAGTFNVQTANHNGSLHTADDSLKVSAAPGGNNLAADANATWGQSFDCASCHAAHGNGSAGASGGNNLNLDPLGWGTVAYATTNTDTQNGKLFKNLTINATVPTTFSTPYILVKSTLADQAAVDANFFYKRAIGTVAGPVDVIQTYRWNNTKYVVDYSLWLQEKGYPYKADTILYGAPVATVATDITRATGMTVVWRDGFAFGPKVAEVTKATISLGVDVETTKDIASLFDSKNVGFIPDSGTQMSKYCSACHTDYLSNTRKDVTGLYTAAHRHKTAADDLTCVRCHFAHGSEAQIMKTSNDQTFYDLIKTGQKFDPAIAPYKDATLTTPQVAAENAAIDYLKDPNPSSALKRYTGMSVCYACHGQGEQFLSNPNNVDHPLYGQPGTVRTALPASSPTLIVVP